MWNVKSPIPIFVWVRLPIKRSEASRVEAFKYLVSIIFNKGFKTRNHVKICPDNTKSFLTERLKEGQVLLTYKGKLMRTLITSIFLYALRDGPLQQRLKEESKAWWRYEIVSYKVHVMTGEVRSRIRDSIGMHNLLAIVNLQKLRCYDHAK